MVRQTGPEDMCMHKYLVVLDDSRECLKAMQYAAMCASKSRRRRDDIVGDSAE